jgi:large subunit ribosomal protein L13
MSKIQIKPWYTIDAKGQILGRLATKVASVLIGKNKIDNTPHTSGGYVVVTNSDKIEVTGKKLQQKTYYKHTGYIGNMKSITLQDQMRKDSTTVIKKAIYGMLPKNRLGRVMRSMLRVYKNSVQPHGEKLITL